MIAAVSPFGCLPVVLVILHLSALVVILVVAECLFEATLATLSQAVESQRDKNEGSGGGGSDVDADMGASAQVVPLFGERLGWVVDVFESSRVPTAKWSVVFEG